MGRLGPDLDSNGNPISNTGTQSAENNSYQVLNADPHWSPQVNDAWLQGGIDAKREFTVTSHPDWTNFRSGVKFDRDGNFSRGNHPKTVFLDEMIKLRDAGYRFKDGKMLPPRE
jgi:hypothetical protein